ncbi:MAG: hypothetical protein WD926_01575 [Patescibacteria group bacterium]
MSAKVPTKAKNGNRSTRGEPTYHGKLRFEPGRSAHGDTGTLLVTAYVDPEIVMNEARRLGAIATIGEQKYFVIEFTFGTLKASGMGSRTAGQLTKMLNEVKPKKKKWKKGRKKR